MNEWSSTLCLTHNHVISFRRLAFPVCKQSLALVPGQKYTPKTQKKKNRKTNWP